MGFIDPPSFLGSLEEWEQFLTGLRSMPDAEKDDEIHEFISYAERAVELTKRLGQPAASLSNEWPDHP